MIITVNFTQFFLWSCWSFYEPDFSIGEFIVHCSSLHLVFLQAAAKSCSVASYVA